MNTNNLTKSYPFGAMSVGDHFTVSTRFQHARVAASEHTRKTAGACVYSCRIDRSEPDAPVMYVYRVASDQRPVDRRGRIGKRQIVTNVEPTPMQFDAWLATFAVGSRYTMPVCYSHLYVAMQAWCELHSIKHGRIVTATMLDAALVIDRVK